jgi:hypothetical protein
MSRYSPEERAEIMRVAREHLAWRPEPRVSPDQHHQRPNDTSPPPHIVRKTYTPADEVHEATTTPTTSSQVWAGWVEGRIEERVTAAIEEHRDFMNELLPQFIAAERNYYDEKLNELEHSIAIVRDEAAVERGLHRLRGKVEAAIKRQPNYERELAGLREELAKAQRQLTRARSNICELEYSLRQMEQQQTKTTYEISRTDVRIDKVGAATEQVLRDIMQEVGADILEDMPVLGSG